MNRLGFRSDRKITDVLAEGRFTLSAEVIPPRNGCEQESILSSIESLVRAGAQFLSVTKGAGGSLRGGSLPIALAIKERFAVPAIAHFTCRDLAPADIENQLMDHHYFGVRNILALRGDPPSDQPDWKPREGSLRYAYELIERIRALNEGAFLSRPEERGGFERERTDFCVGCAVYPEAPTPLERAGYFQKKIEAGAEYAITQMCFDEDAYARFLDECGSFAGGIPVLPGTRVIRSRKQAETMATRFGASVPASFIQELPEDPKASGSRERSIDAFFGLAERFRKAGAPGLHLFVLSEPELACSLYERLGPGWRNR